MRIGEPGVRTFRVCLDIDDYAPEYRKGCDLLIDPDRLRHDGDLILVRIKGVGEPFLARWQRTGRTAKGYRVKAGDPREYFRIGDVPGLKDTAANLERAEWIEFLGVVAGWTIRQIDRGRTLH